MAGQELVFELDLLPKQQGFIPCTAKEQVYAGGVGSGKTLSGCLKAAFLACSYPGSVGLVGRQSYRALQDTTRKVLIDGDDRPPIIPPALIAERSESENRIKLVNGSEILFRSFQDHAIEKLLSLNLAWFYVDECTETTENVWLALLSRLRHPSGPRLGYGTTNPNGHDWVWRRFVSDPARDPAKAATRVLFHAPTEENPNLPADYIQQMRSMPLEWQRRFVDASFDAAAGQIWQEWNEAVHVYPEHVALPAEWRRFEALDHGRRNPTAVLFKAVDGDGNIWVEDEYFSPGLVEQHATAINAKRAALHRPAQPIIADPSTFAAGADGRSVSDLYLEKGVVLMPGSNAVDAGLGMVSRYLLRTPDAVFPEQHPYGGTLGPDGLGAPRLFISSRCHELIGEIPDYRWADLSPAAEKNADQPEKPRKKNDHACDALRYGVMSVPAPFDYSPKPDRDTRPRKATTAGLYDRTF